MTSRPTPSIAALVLAAGRSNRMNGANKLLLPFEGVPLLARTVARVQAAPVADVIVITGHDDRPIRDALEDLEVRIVYNPEYNDGLATSIRRGLLAAPLADGYLICLGNMPFVTTETLSRLCRQFAAAPSPSIVVATHHGQPGHPVLLHRTFRDALIALTGDDGAHAVAEAHPESVVRLEVPDAAILETIDTPETYKRLTQRHTS